MMRPSQKKHQSAQSVTDEDDDTIAIDPNDVTAYQMAWPTTQRQKRLKAHQTVSDWGTTEESRDFPVEIKATDGAGNEATKTITITVQRDTDGDGDPDVTDPDDDNDGIKDEDDKNPKTPDTNLPVITADDATVTEKAPISPIPVTVTDEDDDTIAIDPNDVTGLPDGWPTTQRQKRLKAHQRFPIGAQRKKAETSQ
ncbi:hypothetical protein [Streptococcus thermophilus]|uniref:hypothetical protein n=1 Tax=Streptococcus thermophilus TaxID=1308 RepID=UPI0012FE845B|nr:hypothetical protein [Streptococcus thermophilus]